MKNFVTVLLLLALSACCAACQPTLNSGMADQNLSCATAKVSGMTCEACASVITVNLKKLDGVKDVQVDVQNGAVKIYSANKNAISSSSVQSVVERSGYTFNSLQSGCSQ